MFDKQSAKHRNSISDGQLAIVKLLYKYRFGSSELLRISLGLNEGPGVYKKLKILCDDGYVARRYDKSYKIQGMPAAYYLLAKGYRELQRYSEFRAIDDKLIKYSYKDKTVGKPFVGRNLNVYRATVELQRLYPDIKIFTKRELIGRKHFPPELPDLFVSLKADGDDKPHRFFLDFIPANTPRPAIDKRIADYNKFFDEGGWDSTGSALPTMLLLCELGADEKRVQRWVRHKQNALDSDEPAYYTSTLPALKIATSDSLEIWSSIDEPDELLSLLSIPS
ncbi:MAG TPA: hypothetical protein VMB52_00430 [Verrucomicrobiae bacterium]|nr:hypothetical protein [Verrucomicrobiae bacterium]